MAYSLSCNCTNCVNNERGLCEANNINVSGMNAHASQGTQCDTFMEKGLKNAFSSMSNINVAGELKQLYSNASIEMAPNIRCSALNCRYNSNQMCTANDVKIDGTRAITSSKTCCDTFIE